jgi:ribonuclease P protein component
MLPKKNRADKKTIEEIFKKGRFVASSNLTLKYIKTDPLLPFNISFVVPKTVSKSAVIRNLLRRRGYNVIKKYLKHFSPGFKGVFVFGKKSNEFFGGTKTNMYNPMLNLENELRFILNKL